MRLMNLCAVFATASIALATPQPLTLLCVAVCGRVTGVSEYIDDTPKTPLRSL